MPLRRPPHCAASAAPVRKLHAVMTRYVPRVANFRARPPSAARISVWYPTLFTEYEMTSEVGGQFADGKLSISVLRLEERPRALGVGRTTVDNLITLENARLSRPDI